MNKKTLTKIMKGSAIVGGVYLLSDFSYQIGKGRMLGFLAKNYEDVSELMSTFDDPDMQSWRPKIVKIAADMELKKEES